MWEEGGGGEQLAIHYWFDKLEGRRGRGRKKLDS